jgi:uncharacterized protein (DUF1501 family)
MTPDRRRLLLALGAGAGLAATGVLGGSGPLARLAFAAPGPGSGSGLPPPSGRFVFVLLRGGLDGLHAVPLLDDAHFRRLRGPLLEGPAPRPLNADFGLHPALDDLHAAYTDGALAIVHAVATPYRERSHFDGQDVLENGGTRPMGLDTGWLGRAALAAGCGGLALAPSAPLVLRGAAPLSTWVPSPFDEPGDDLLARVAAMYRGHPALSATLVEARKAAATRREVTAAGDAPPTGMGPLPDGTEPAAAGRRGPQSLRGRPETLADHCALALSARDGSGPAVAVLEMGGFDSHAGQAAPEGRLSRTLGALSDVVDRLRTGLAPVWSRTCIVVATEFGRTVAANGTLGTDHGTAGVCFVLGGGVAGGRVLGAFPGLAPGELYEGRDLRPTTDLRAVLKAALHATLGLSEATLAETVFPDSAAAAVAVPPLEGLFRRG